MELVEVVLSYINSLKPSYISAVGDTYHEEYYTRFYRVVREVDGENVSYILEFKNRSGEWSFRGLIKLVGGEVEKVVGVKSWEDFYELSKSI